MKYDHAKELRPGDEVEITCEDKMEQHGISDGETVTVVSKGLDGDNELQVEYDGEEFYVCYEDVELVKMGEWHDLSEDDMVMLKTGKEDEYTCDFMEKNELYQIVSIDDDGDLSLKSIKTGRVNKWFDRADFRKIDERKKVVTEDAERLSRWISQQ